MASRAFRVAAVLAATVALSAFAFLVTRMDGGRDPSEPVESPSGGLHAKASTGSPLEGEGASEAARGRLDPADTVEVEPGATGAGHIEATSSDGVQGEGPVDRAEPSRLKDLEHFRLFLEGQLEAALEKADPQSVHTLLKYELMASLFQRGAYEVLPESEGRTVYADPGYGEVIFVGRSGRVRFAYSESDFPEYAAVEQALFGGIDAEEPLLKVSELDRELLDRARTRVLDTIELLEGGRPSENSR